MFASVDARRGESEKGTGWVGGPAAFLDGMASSVSKHFPKRLQIQRR